MKHLVLVVALLAGCVDSVGPETPVEQSVDETEEVLCNCYDSSCSAASDAPCVEEQAKPPGEHPTVTATKY